MFLNKDFEYMVKLYLNHMRLKSSDGIFMLGYTKRVARASTNEEHLQHYLPNELHSPLHKIFDDQSTAFPSEEEREKFFNLFYFNKGLNSL